MRFSTVRVVGLSVSAAPAVRGAAPDKGPSFRKALVAPRQAGRHPAHARPAAAKMPKRKVSSAEGAAKEPRVDRGGCQLHLLLRKWKWIPKRRQESMHIQTKKKKKRCKQKGKGKHTKCQFGVSRAYVLNILNYFYSHVFGRIIS